MDWKAKLDIEAEKEFEILSQKTTPELLEMIEKGDYGRFNRIWKAVSIHAELEEIGWPFYSVLKTTEDEITRVACARALLSVILSECLDIKPHHFLNINENLADSILQVRKILVKKLGEKNAQ